MKNEIIIEPHAGLVNRMRVIASGLWLGDICNTKIKMVWNVNDDLNCPFDELFEDIPNLEIIDKKFSYRFIGTIKNKNFIKHIARKVLRKTLTSKYKIMEDSEVKELRKDELELARLQHIKKSLYFSTCEEFGNNKEKYKLFIPKPDILDLIKNTSKKFNTKTIGVHIRRTDHSVAIKNSPTELFIKRMLRDIEIDPEINFFLSTDDTETEKQIISKFGNKIIINKKDFSRNSTKGIKDAVVDFYCLANTTKIYGSHWSSFSYISARINNIKYEALKKN